MPSTTQSRSAKSQGVGTTGLKAIAGGKTPAKKASSPAKKAIAERAMPRATQPRRRLGEFEGEEVIQSGCNGADNVTKSLRSFFRATQRKLEHAEPVVIVLRGFVNGINHKAVVGAEDAAEREHHFRVTEAFLSPDSTWQALQDEANRVNALIAEAEAAAKGQDPLPGVGIED